MADQGGAEAARARTVGRRDRGRRAGVAPVVVAGGLLLAACGDGGGGGGELTVTSEPDGASVAALFAASEQTAAAGSGRMRLAMTIEGEVDGSPLRSEVTAEGEFDDVARRFEVTMDMGEYMADIAEAAGGSEAGVPDLDDLSLSYVVDGTTIYTRFDGPEVPGLPQGWISMDGAQFAGDMGLSTGNLGAPVSGIAGPGGFLATLQGAGADVDVIEDDQLDGVAVTRYEGTIDPSAALDGADPETRDELEQLFAMSGLAAPMPFTAWVDADGVVRQMDVTQTAEAGPMSLEVTTRMELFDLGEPVDIQVPPPSEVTPYEEVFGDGLSGSASIGATA